MGSISAWGNEIFNIFSVLAFVTRQSAVLSTAIQHAIPAEYGGKWAIEDNGNGVSKH